MLCMQDDIMHVNLTVEENLMFSARYRLPSHYTHSQHVFYVERAIQVALDAALCMPSHQMAVMDLC